MIEILKERERERERERVDQRGGKWIAGRAPRAMIILTSQEGPRIIEPLRYVHYFGVAIHVVCAD